MISFQEALEEVLQQKLDLGNESVALMDSVGRVLAEDCMADRDFPPFNRATKDGIALNFEAIAKGRSSFFIEGVQGAGTPQNSLASIENCFEIMTGAVLPKNADTIVMYEQLSIEKGYATLNFVPNQGQNIHTKGSDKKQGAVLVPKGKIITAAVIGVLASIGQTTVLVKKMPKVCVISTGNELVEISETPLPHQIRKSNTFSLAAALHHLNIIPTSIHLNDTVTAIEKGLKEVISTHDVLLLSGGVSKGKFDFIPDVLAKLGVQKVFHRVAQRPGKPFWFGVREDSKVVFSFPGNPVSTLVNYHIYFVPWLRKSLGLAFQRKQVVLTEQVEPHPTLALFVQVRIIVEQERLLAEPIWGNGSGDLISLAFADGFVLVPASENTLPKGSVLHYIEA